MSRKRKVKKRIVRVSKENGSKRNPEDVFYFKNIKQFKMIKNIHMALFSVMFLIYFTRGVLSEYIDIREFGFAHATAVVALTILICLLINNIKLFPFNVKRNHVVILYVLMWVLGFAQLISNMFVFDGEQIRSLKFWLIIVLVMNFVGYFIWKKKWYRTP